MSVWVAKFDYVIDFLWFKDSGNETVSLRDEKIISGSLRT